MAAASLPTDPVLRFRAFAAEVAEILDQLAAGTLPVRTAPGGSGGSNTAATAASMAASGATAPTDTSATAAPPAIYDAVRVRLVPFLAPPAAGSASNPLTDTSRYLMAAFGDDTFLNLDWAGQVAWQRSTLEKQFFGTEDGATEILSRIDQLIAAPGPRAVPQARMYLIALALGFEGALRGTSGAEAELAEKRRSLGALIAAGDPRDPATAGRLFPDAYRHTLEGGKPQTLPRAGIWALSLLLVLIAWWAISWPLWRAGTSELRSLLQTILPAS